jgi:hypothetical protein
VAHSVSYCGAAICPELGCKPDSSPRIEANIGGTVDYQTATMDIADYLKQGGQTTGHRELWRLLRTLFKEGNDPDEVIE